MRRSVSRISNHTTKYLLFLKKTCVRQVVLDKWFPLTEGQFTYAGKNPHDCESQVEMFGDFPFAWRKPTLKISLGRTPPPEFIVVS